MVGPNVQIGFNDEVVKVMWISDITGTHMSYNLYYDTVVGMGGESLVANVPNVPDTYYSKIHVTYAFRRSAIGVSNDTEFYLRVKGVLAGGAEDTPGAVRLIPSLSAQREEYNAVQMYGYDSVKQLWKRIKVTDDGTLA